MSDLPLKLKFARDRSGRPRAEWKASIPESGHWLTEWLESDLQDTATCRQISAQAGSIHQAGTGSWKTTGNAFRLLVGPRRALLTPLFGPPGARPFRIPTRQLIALIEAWSAHV
jgi:hypothetical protein